MGHLCRPTYNTHLKSAKASQEGIKCTKTKEYLRAYFPNIYTVNSGSKLSIPRPDFGLEIHNSPKPKPVTLVTAADVLEVELFLF